MKTFPFYRRKVKKNAMKKLAKVGADFIRESMKQKKNVKI